MAWPRFRATERQVLLLILAASFVGFAAALLLGGFRGRRGQGLAPTGQARIHWMPPQQATPLSPMAYRIADYFDPSLMSLPNPRGFSARLWQRSADTPARAFEPAPELAWLQPTPIGQPETLLGEPALAKSVNAIIEKAPAMEEGVESEDPPPVSGVVTQTILRVEGALQSRGLRSQPDLPAVAAGTALVPTRIRLAVAPDGRVRYVALDQTCGNESVDARALADASRLLFEPVTSADPLTLTWGVVKFLWAIHN